MKKNTLKILLLAFGMGSAIVGIGQFAQAATPLKGFKIGPVQLCADFGETIKTLRAAGYDRVSRYARVPKFGMMLGANKRTAQYRYTYSSINWNRGKVNSINQTIAGEDAYKNLFAREKRRFEKASGLKMTCKNNGKQHSCIYRDRKTHTAFYISAALHEKTRIGINMRSGCR